MKTPKSFAKALAETHLPSVFNPYADFCPTHDRADAAFIRRRNLVRCLDAAIAAHVDTIWIARDLGISKNTVADVVQRSRQEDVA